MRLVLVWAALLATPLAAAQLPVHVVTPTLALIPTAPGAPLALDATARLPYRIDYAIAGPHAGTFLVIVAPGAIPPGWSVTLDPPQHEIQAAPSTGATYTVEGTIVIRHDGTPLAFQPQALALDAYAPGDGSVVAATTTSAGVPLTADWRPGLLVELPAPRLHLHERGGSDTLGGEIWNTGNADARIEGSILRAPRGCSATLESAPTHLAPGQRAPLRLALQCERGWDPGSVTARFEHALAVDATRAGAPVEPQWDVVVLDTSRCDGFWGCSGSSSGGVARTYGDAPITGRNEASWGATLLVPMALAVAAMLVRRR